MNIKESVCVVTGATEGIGRAIALALGQRGARLALCARTRERVRATVDDLTSQGIDAWGAPCDVSEHASVASFAEQVSQQRGPVQVVVNNAGLGHIAPFTDLTVRQIDESLAVNVKGVMLVTKAFLPGMLERKSGQIVNIVSLAGRNGFVGGTVYSASKHAVLGFSRSLMLEVRKSNIRVIAVCPGSVETPFFDKAGVELPNADKVLQPQDVAEAVVAALELPARALVSELDLRPTNP